MLLNIRFWKKCKDVTSLNRLNKILTSVLLAHSLLSWLDGVSCHDWGHCMEGLTGQGNEVVSLIAPKQLKFYQ